jgi:hypothetical protein
MASRPTVMMIQCKVETLMGRKKLHLIMDIQYFFMQTDILYKYCIKKVQGKINK